MEGSSSISFLCHENPQSCINDDEQKLDKTQFDINPFCDFEYEDDYIANLVKKELNFQSNLQSLDYPSWLRDFRFEAVQWILNTRNLLKFGNQTAYLSVSYLDRFLSIRFIDEDKLWAIRLLSVACLSLAAKMEECKVTSLTEYPVSDLGFDCRSIKRMELLILSTFNWKMSLVTPFAYLHFFVKKLENQTIAQEELIARAVELLVALIQEIRLTEYRPSVIAAAAVLAASDYQMTQETFKLKLDSVSLWETSDNQDQQLHSCYSLMQRLSTKGNISTPNLSQVHHTSDELPCIVGTKRRLTFTDGDPNPNSPDKIRRD